MAIAVLAACSQTESPPPPGEPIACAIGAGAELSAVCTLETVEGDGVFLIHHPDGGFRRFRMIDGVIVTNDGAGRAAAQEPDASGKVEIAVDGDRYLVPLGGGYRR
ncbi:hypothetical protein [Erythrobacter sp. R86502]|uniref:hypothetical protein n=1 Tax=Erythrobacter sp. R86502 TaxID=3093846 RepID=UPI0036D29356